MDVFSLQNFMTAQATLLIVGVIFLLWRRPDQRFRLKMRTKGQSFGNLPVRKGTERIDVSSQARASAKGTSAAISYARSLSLNIHFNYNGHSFDAYEVLGLPAGSSLARVRSAYSAATKTADEASREFLECALHAIEKHVQ